MLENIFLRILQMSFTASIVILAVFLLRLLLQKAPKIFSYVLWIAVLFRLLCPVSFSSVCSVFSIFQKTDAAFTDYMQPGQWNLKNYTFANSHKTTSSKKAPVLSKTDISTDVNSSAQVDISEFLPTCAVWIWLTGIFVLAGYNAIALLCLHKKLKNAVAKGKQLYISDQIETPFVLGIKTPRIYLPNFLESREYEYILFHEQIHIRRKDYLFRFLSFLALCLHWFNPLVWTAFFYSGKDMEMSCDEAVIRKVGETIKKEYSSSLLNLTTGNHMATGFPLQFGENDTKKRVKNVLHYKKITIGAITAIIILVAGSIFILISNPKNPADATTFTQEQKTQGNLPKEKSKIIKAEKTFQDAIQGAIIDVNVKSIAKSAKCIDRFTLAEDNEEWDKQAEGVELAFAENCTYRINYKRNKINYTKVDFNTFANVINQGETDVCKYCSLIFTNGLIVAADLLNGNYMDGISYTEKFPDQAWYETVMENELYNSYIKLFSIEADVAETTGIETVEIYTDKEKNNAETGMILVKSVQGNILYSEKTDIKKSTLINESINLGTLDGTDFLMTIHAEDRDIYGDYTYEVFRLDAQGDTIPIAGSSFTFNTSKYPFPKTAFQKWTKEMDNYYKATKPLVIKKNDKIITNWNETKRNQYHDAIFTSALEH